MTPARAGPSSIPVAKIQLAKGLLQKKPQTGKDDGFTLLELMVVLALLTLLIGLVLPGLLKSYQREQERTKIRNFLTILRSARSEAVTRHQRVRLEVDVHTGNYNLEGFTGKGSLNELAPGGPPPGVGRYGSKAGLHYFLPGRQFQRRQTGNHKCWWKTIPRGGRYHNGQGKLQGRRKMNRLKCRQINYRLDQPPDRTGSEGFSLLEVLVATALVGLLLVVLLQILSTVFRTEEGIWKNSQALILAEKVLQEKCELSSLAAGVFQGREGDFDYQVKISPQYEVSSPLGELHIRCSLIQVTVSWRGWQQKKMLILETARTAAAKKS